MPKKRPPLDRLTSAERKKLLTRSQYVLRQPEVDIRFLKHKQTLGRILVITPKKMGTAPQRNLIRRRLKALFYEEEFYKQPFDVVVYCKKGSSELSFQELKKIFLKAYETSYTERSSDSY